MLSRARDLTGAALEARDGAIGRCKDVLFDDREWTARYLVVDTGRWLPGRKVLVSPLFVGPLRPGEGGLPVDLSREEIERSPPLDEHAPVSRREERAYLDFHHLPYYWPGTGLWGTHSTPEDLRLARVAAREATRPAADDGDRTLRSVREVEGYRLQAVDEEVGHVEDFLLEDRTWAIRYLVADTRNWLPGRRVLLAPAWVRSVVWPDEVVYVDLDAESIRRSPEYDASKRVERSYEAALYDHYGRPPYWR